MYNMSLLLGCDDICVDFAGDDKNYKKKMGNMV